jgi:hypothetical protein
MTNKRINNARGSRFEEAMVEEHDKQGRLYLVMECAPKARTTTEGRGNAEIVYYIFSNLVD